MSTPTDRPARKTDRTQQVLDAASKCFVQNGFHGTSMAELAKQAGMSVGHIYHYFANKEAIIAAIVRQEAERQLERFRELRQEKDLVQGLLDRAAEALARRLDRGQAGLWLEVLAEAGRNPAVTAVIREADETFRSAWCDALRQSIGLSEPELGARVDVLIALFEGMTIRAVRHPGLSPESLVHALQVAIRALLATPTRPN